MATVQPLVRVTGTSGSRTCSRDLTSEQWYALLALAPLFENNKVCFVKLIRAFAPMDLHEALMLVNAAIEMEAKNEVNHLAA